MSGFVSLELQIISINIISLFNGIWSWIKWNQRLEKISSFSVSDKLLDVKDIDWLKTVLLWIEVIRLIINRVSLLAYIINICTITARKWQNLLIFWMVLSLLKDIVLEVVVIIITFLQWYKRSITTLLLVWFIMEKTVWLVISTLKWFTILKWYTQLRKEAKIRKFTRIARRSIASIVNIPGRIGHSLNDECLDIATVRRDKYVSLLNLNKLSEKSSNKVNFELRISKSLTTLITNDDSHDLNDTNDSSVHDLSVTEKSMKMLGLTAEDVMDAYARIQERSYWGEQDVTMKTPEAMEKVVAQFSLEKGGEEMDASRREQKDNVEKAVDCNLMKKVMQNSQMEKKGEEDNKTISIDKKEQILIDKQQDGSLTKSEDVTFDRVDSRVKLTEFQKFQEDALSRKKKREEEEEKLARIKHCPLSSAQCTNARNMEIKPCASLVKKLEAKLRPVSTNQREKWFDQLDRRKYRAKLTPTGSDANKKECYKNSRTSLCACRRASKKNTDASRNGKFTRSTDVNDKNVKHDIDRKELAHFVSIVSARKDKMDNSAFKYSEAYRLKKQIQKSEESSKPTIAWGSMSLAQTARPSGYTKNVAATNKSPRIYQRNVQIEACNESSDSLNAQSKWRVRSKQSTDPRSIHNTPFTEKNYARSENREAKALESRNDLTLLTNKRGVRAKKRHDLSPNRKLSSKEREAIELRALRTFNELTLLEDKKKLEAKKKNHNSLLDYEPTRESEVSEAKVFKSYNGLTLLKEQKEINAINEHNSSSNYKQLIGESSALKVFNEYTSSKNKGELKTEGKHESSKYEIPERYEENIETSTSVSSHLPEINHEETRILSETHRNANSSSELNEHHAGQAYMSLNLREITRNIEWTAHPRGVILTNKNLHRQCLENGRIRESQQRDIVDDNVASTLHSAFFFKPEIVTRIFRRAQMRIGESLPSFSTFWREDFNTEFVCQVNNETIAQWNRDSSASFNFDLERIMGDRNNFGNSSFPDANDNRVAGEDNRDLCIIFIDQEQASQDSETAIIENSRTTVGSQENARSSVENIESIFLMCILREFGVEVSEESLRDVISSTEQIEEYGDISNVIVNNVDFQSSNFNANDTSPEERNINRNENTISLQQQILHSNDNCSEDVDVTSSSVNFLPHDNLPDKKYMSTIDISSEKKEIHENNSSIKNDSNAASSLSNSSNNNQFDTLVDKNEKIIFNCIPENASQLSFPGSSSFVKENSQSILKSSDQEELQRLTQLSDSEVTLVNQERELIMNLETTNYDKVLQSENVETLNILETTTQDDARNEDENRDVYEKANISSHRFSTINQDDRLQQDDSFYSMFEKNNSTETPVSLGDGSVMEEFSNSTIPPETSSNASTKNSEHSQ